jgi:hypothetical protein
VPPKPPFPRIDRAKEERRRIAMKVEIQESTISFDVLLAEIPQERTLASTGLAEDRNMLRAAHITQCHMPPRYIAVCYSNPKIQTSPLLPYSAASAQEAPDRRNELFYERKHGDWTCERGTAEAATRRKKQLRYIFKVQIAHEVRYLRKFVIRTSR